jgi:lactoylglutathione lyase
MEINLLVIRSENPEKLKNQYEILGHKFEYHQHGNGPFHYASEHGGFVLEIYPLTKSMEKADNSLRIGFEIQDLKAKMEELKNSNWTIVSDVKETEWGVTAVIQDLDGRKIELKNK